MTQRHFVVRWLAVLALALQSVGALTQSATTVQTPLAETRQKADHGDASAQFALGVRYAFGLGVPQDVTQAVAWYRKAADQGLASAQYNLGVRYADGQGVPQDVTQAVAWFRKAADQGDADAQFNLGAMYFKGEGVPQDHVEAHKWCNLAASRATGNSQERYAATRDATAKNMPPAQLAEAQKRVADWQAAFEERQK